VYSYDGPFFTGSIVRIQAQRTSSPEFNLLQLETISDPGMKPTYSTSFRGDGTIVHSGNLLMNGSVSVRSVKRGSADEDTLTLESVPFEAHRTSDATMVRPVRACVCQEKICL